MGQIASQSYCRLFLATPTCFEVDDMVLMLEAALAAGDVACLLIGHDDLSKLEKAAKKLTPIAQNKDVAVLIEGSLDIALSAMADGAVVAGHVQEYAQARKALGEDKIVGVDCGVDRHSAMALGELGADFVMFDDAAVGADIDVETTETALAPTQINEPIGNWWAQVFEVPCVIMGPKSIENARASIASGVEFVCPVSTMWKNAETAAIAVGKYNQLIKETPVDET